MKRRITISTLFALMLVLSITVTALAAGPGPNAATVPGSDIAGQGAALNGTFVDEDGDGVCDTYTGRAPVQDGPGSWWNSGSQTGSGVPVGAYAQNGAGQQMQRGGRWSWNR